MWAFYTLINLFRKLILYFSFTIPHKVATVNLRNYSLLFRTVSVTCMIPYQRAIVSNLIFISVVLGRSWGKIFLQNQRGDKSKIYLLVKLHGEVCLTACLNKNKVLIGKHFLRYFKENVGTHLKVH